MAHKLHSIAASFALLLSLLSSAAAFTTNSFITAAPNTNAASHVNHVPFSTEFSTPTTSLAMSNDKEEPYDTGYVDGSTTGAFLMAFVLLVNVWIFSIPTEFRRARICKEEDVIMYPNKNCITANEWVKGVGDYYANGGGVKFDFSIEGR